MTDHATVREELELAALEPGGLERLAAGDTATSAAIAGHLAGCPTCAEEARRLAIVGPLLADAVRSMPPDDLRARTLTLVQEIGDVRGADPGPAVAEAAAADARPAGPRTATKRSRRRLAWPLAAAAVLVAFVAGSVLVGVPLAQRTGSAEARVAELTALAAATQRLASRPDATRVALAAAGGAAHGTLVFSPGSQELVVSASGLGAVGDDRVYACWIAGPDGRRTRIGQMSLDGDLAYWAGWSEELAGARPGTTFGVTLVDGSGAPVGPGDVLTGVVTDG